MRDYRELHQLPRSDIVSMGTVVGEGDVGEGGLCAVFVINRN